VHLTLRPGEGAGGCHLLQSRVTAISTGVPRPKIRGGPVALASSGTSQVSFFHLVAESRGKVIAGRSLAHEDPKFPGAIVCGSAGADRPRL
jgi:hypothetical protein